MATTRDNHYVPQWYQRDFFPPDRESLWYLDLKPTLYPQRDGALKPGKSLFDWPPAKCFYRTDLYSTHFLFHIDDEIERRLFGDIDGRGSTAVRAFQGTDPGAWVECFNDLFEYLDAQRLRTPKGLDWLQSRYPALDQNQLMFEMQGVRMMNISLWSECVKEIVSAEDAGEKFIISDHPVTTYNHAVPPGDARCAYPGDPSITWKGTQTVFPLNQDLCLILTNLEYAEDPTLPDPCAKRTNARNFRPALVRADHFIRTRRLNDDAVKQINYVLKARANRYVAAGYADWLHPDRDGAWNWADIRHTLMPPPDKLHMFGGDIYVGFEDGSVEHRDAYGRTEPRPAFLSTAKMATPTTNKDPCGCGSGQPFGVCCAKRPAELRPSWSELSIRERNIFHFNAIAQILGFSEGSDWTKVRQEITPEKIAEIHRVFRAIWPEDTDLVSLLPKPDGRLRALFTGMIDPRTLIEYAFGAVNQFGEVLIQNPFIRDAHIAPEYSPIDSPGQYHLETIKNVSLLVELMPLIDAGLVNLFPDPVSFDPHLRGQMMHMATERSRLLHGKVKPDVRSKWLGEDDMHRAILFKPESFHRAQMRKASPDITDERIEETIALLNRTRHLDPLAPLNLDLAKPGERNALLMPMHLAPNFEISLYLAQATGSVIVTDCPHRWRELRAASLRNGENRSSLPGFSAAIAGEEFLYLGHPHRILKVRKAGSDEPLRTLLHDATRYLGRSGERAKPNWESQLPNRLRKANTTLRRAITKADPEALVGRMQCLAPAAGIRDNAVSRLLLMTSVEHHLDAVPLAFFIQRADPTTYNRPYFSHPWNWAT